MDTSPTKRRVLAALDVNTSSPNSAHIQSKQRDAKADIHQRTGALAQALSTRPPEQDQKKRPLAAALSESPKRICVEDVADREQGKNEAKRTGAVEERPALQSPGRSVRQRSVSPEASSVFDSSGLDTSHATTLTEPEADAANQAGPGRGLARAPARGPAWLALQAARHRFTREEARQKAEILRLRLGLASYKLRTGQTDVPLEDLQMRPVPGAARRALVPFTRAEAPGTGQSRRLSIAALAEGSATAPLQRRPLPSAPGQTNTAERTGAEKHDGERSSGGSSSRLASHGQTAPSLIHQQQLPSPERSLLPRLPPHPALNTPRRRALDDDADRERLTSSGLRGGAASGLLSLARG